MSFAVSIQENHFNPPIIFNRKWYRTYCANQKSINLHVVCGV